MRTLTVLTAGALTAWALAAAGAAAAEPAVWQGDLFVTNVTSTCTTTGVTDIGNFYRSIYRPNIAPPPPGQAKEALLVTTTRAAFILEAKGNTLRGAASASETDLGSRATVGTAPTSVVLSITPAKIVASTPVVQIAGKINNFFNLAGCTTQVVGALGRRP